MTVQDGIVKYVSLVFALTYILIGIGILWKSEELSKLLNGYSIPLGIIFISYGLFRGYRAYQRYF
jgi:hypothetical protein